MRNGNLRFPRENVHVSKEGVHVSRGGVRVAIPLINSNILVTLFLFSNIHVRMNKRKEKKF